MPRILETIPVAHMPKVRLVSLECGHTLLRTYDNTTIERGRSGICEACLMRGCYPLIKSMTASSDGKVAEARLTCGHIYQITLGTLFTVENISALVGTSTQCNQCVRESDQKA